MFPGLPGRLQTEMDTLTRRSRKSKVVAGHTRNSRKKKANTHHQAIVMDNGSWMTRAGFDRDHAPRAVFRSVIGKPREPDNSQNLADIYIGNEALEKRHDLNLGLKYPIEFGSITNWDDIEKLWEYVFSSALHVDPSDHPIFLTEPSMNAKCNREKMTEIMFEKIDVPAMYIAPQPVLSLCACGRTTGAVLHVGQSTCHMVPVYDGYSLRHTVMKLPIGGQYLSDYLMTMLRERGYTFMNSADWKSLNDVKENLGFVSQNFEEDMKKSQTLLDEKSYQLPDGRVIKIGNERFRCTEPLFNPPMIGQEMPGVHEILCNAIKRCDIDIISELYANIIIAGGSAMFSGFKERLEKEMKTLIRETYEVNVTTASEHSAWIGGSMLAQMSTFKNMWIDKNEYDEHGPALIHRKCLN